MKARQYEFYFVSRIPDEIENGRLYICLDCNVAIHRCACGCGEKVVTPIDPRGWTITYDGETISLSPSIGNWSFDCKSHYFIRRNRVVWAQPWREYDSIDQIKESTPANRKEHKQKKNIWGRIFNKK